MVERDQLQEYFELQLQSHTGRYAAVKTEHEARQRFLGHMPNRLSLFNRRSLRRQINRSKAITPEPRLTATPLNGTSVASNPPQASTKDSRALDQELLQKKQAETKQFLQKYKEEKRILHDFKKQQNKLQQHRDKMFELEQAQLQQSKKEDLQQRYMVSLMKQKENRMRRQVEAETNRSHEMAHGRLHKDRKPLFMIMEEQFFRDVQIPEIEAKKKALEAKRQQAQPIRQQALQEHAHMYDEIAQEFEARRAAEFRQRRIDHRMNYQVSQSMASRFTREFQTRDRLAAEEKDLAVSQNHKLADKKKQYSNIVKELYTPQIDRMKQMEMQIMKERVTAPQRPKRATASAARDSSLNGLSKYTSNTSLSSIQNREARSLSMQTKTNRPASLSPTPPPLLKSATPSIRSQIVLSGKEKKVKTDYLADQRKKRDQLENKVGNLKIPDARTVLGQDLSSRSFDNPETLRNQANKMENDAKRYELILDGISNTNAEKIIAVQKINDIYLESIKTKIALLENSDD